MEASGDSDSDGSDAEAEEKAGQSASDGEDASEIDSDEEIAKRELNEQEDLEEQFGLTAINDEEGMLKRLKEI